MKKTLVYIALFFFAFFAKAEPITSVYGFNMGKPLSLPQCGNNAVTNVICTGEWAHNTLIWKENGSFLNGIYIMYPTSEVPDGFSKWFIDGATDENHNLVMLTIETTGKNSQDSIFSYLSSIPGAKLMTLDKGWIFDNSIATGAVIAHWEMPDNVHIVFLGELDNTGNGRIKVMTGKTLWILNNLNN